MSHIHGTAWLYLGKLLIGVVDIRYFGCHMSMIMIPIKSIFWPCCRHIRPLFDLPTSGIPVFTIYLACPFLSRHAHIEPWSAREVNTSSTELDKTRHVTFKSCCIIRYVANYLVCNLGSVLNHHKTTESRPVRTSTRLTFEKKICSLATLSVRYPSNDITKFCFI